MGGPAVARHLPQSSWGIKRLAPNPRLTNPSRKDLQASLGQFFPYLQTWMACQVPSSTDPPEELHQMCTSSNPA